MVLHQPVNIYNANTATREVGTVHGVHQLGLLGGLGMDSDLVGIHIVEGPWQAGDEVKPKSRGRDEILECYSSDIVAICIRNIQGASEELGEDF
jgi:hypothetical protein